MCVCVYTYTQEHHDIYDIHGHISMCVHIYTHVSYIIELVCIYMHLWTITIYGSKKRVIMSLVLAKINRTSYLIFDLLAVILPIPLII